MTRVIGEKQDSFRVSLGSRDERFLVSDFQQGFSLIWSTVVEDPLIALKHFQEAARPESCYAPELILPDGSYHELDAETNSLEMTTAVIAMVHNRLHEYMCWKHVDSNQPSIQWLGNAEGLGQAARLLQATATDFVKESQEFVFDALSRYLGDVTLNASSQS